MRTEVEVTKKGTHIVRDESGAVLMRSTTNWGCPDCGQLFVTHIRQPHSPFHVCPAHHGAMTPFVDADRLPVASFRLNRREDYLGKDTQATDADGRPVMSITTLRPDGEDCHAFAPTIRLKIE